MDDGDGSDCGGGCGMEGKDSGGMDRGWMGDGREGEGREYFCRDGSGCECAVL